MRHIELFAAGQGGYHTYRIPSLLVTGRGTILAFAEARRHGRGDSGDIDLLVRRSSDGGQTWSAPSVVWDDGDNTCGNPCPVVDRDTGTIWLATTWNLGTDTEKQINHGQSQDTRRPFVLRSDDDGRTWSSPRQITEQVKRPDWRWYATGPGCAIQLARGPHAGRLLVPCNRFEADGVTGRSHVIYSDDHGHTWQLGGQTPLPGTNESQVAELADGQILMTMRSVDPTVEHRQFCVSHDGGTTFVDPYAHPDIVDPICQASLIRHPGRDALVFANPASRARENLTVRVSRDGGRTWPLATPIHPGPAAYSSLAVLTSGSIGLLYEAGTTDPYESIRFTEISLDRTLD